MVTPHEYLKNILEQIMHIYNTVYELEDKPGDLEIIDLELRKINGFFQVLINKIGTEGFTSSDLSSLKSRIKNYMENYYFEREIEIMAPLYSEDTHRIKNIRLKILEALNDKKLIAKIESILSSL